MQIPRVQLNDFEVQFKRRILGEPEPPPAIEPALQQILIDVGLADLIPTFIDEKVTTVAVVREVYNFYTQPPEGAPLHLKMGDLIEIRAKLGTNRPPAPAAASGSV